MRLNLLITYDTGQFLLQHKSKQNKKDITFHFTNHIHGIFCHRKKMLITRIAINIQNFIQLSKHPLITCLLHLNIMIGHTALAHLFYDGQFIMIYNVMITQEINWITLWILMQQCEIGPCTKNWYYGRELQSFLSKNQHVKVR